MQIASIEKVLLGVLSADQVSVNESVRELHGRDESYHAMSLPDVVVFPRSAGDVQAVMRVAAEFDVPVVPFGRGTSLEGHVIPYDHGITVDFSLMDRILEVRPDDFLVRVQPGVTRSQLNQELKKFGLFFSVDPGADATLGGMAATNASGTTSVKYGIMRDQVRDLEVVLADGTIFHTGNLAAKSSSGLHLNGLFVGSEGTLGCFTELTLRVYGIPEHVVAGRAVFPSVRRAVEAVTGLLQSGISIARVELVDEHSVKQVNHHAETSYEEAPTLFLELHGNEAGLAYDVDLMQTLLADYDCESVSFESNTAARNQLWDARHNLAYSFVHGFPGKKLMVTDVCVPMSELAGAIDHAREAIQKRDLTAGIVGHVGDGNYHALLMLNPDDPHERQQAEAFNEEIVQYALSKGGTCTGEHGVGTGKRKYQLQEHGAALGVMTLVKQALDPEGRMNPNKLFGV